MVSRPTTCAIRTGPNLHYVLLKHSSAFRKQVIGPEPKQIEPGRYTVDEISTDPLPSGHTARRWGVLLKLDEGTIIEEPDPWDEYSPLA